MLYPDKFHDLHVHLSDTTIDENMRMLDALRSFNVNKVNIPTINYMDCTVDENLMALYVKDKYKKAQITVFGGLYYDAINNFYRTPFLKQAEKLLELGCDGIKLIEEKPSFRRHVGFGLNAKQYDAMFDMLEEKQIPLLIHVADPDTFWDRSKLTPEIISYGWCYDDPSYLSYNEVYDEIFARMDRNPKLKVVFAHFMFLSNDLEKARWVLERYPNVGFDLTPGWEMYVGFSTRIDDWREFFTKYSNRIFYGTDTAGNRVDEKIHETVRSAISLGSDEIVMPHVPDAKMRCMHLDKEAQLNICQRNFDAFIGTPKPVNRPLLLSEMKTLKHEWEVRGGADDVVNRLTEMIETL